MKRVCLHGGLAEKILTAFGSCVYCGARARTRYAPPRVGRWVVLEVEHIVPVARGGDNALTNLTVACRSCNRSKRTKTAEEFGFPNVRTAADAFVSSVVRN